MAIWKGAWCDGAPPGTKEIRKHQARVFGKTKFEKILRYASANLFYLVATDGICQAHEVPEGWGLLVHREDTDELELRRKPRWVEAEESIRLALLERLANTSTRQLNAALGIEIEEIRLQPLKREKP